MLFDQNRVDAIIHNWKNQVFSNETIPGVPQRHSTCLKTPIGGFRNLASSLDSWLSYVFCLSSGFSVTRHQVVKVVRVVKLVSLSHPVARGLSLTMTTETTRDKRTKLCHLQAMTSTTTYIGNVNI